MSYEPTLIISKEDLNKHQDLFENGIWQYGADKKDEATRGGEEGKTVMEYLNAVYLQKPITVRGVELVICSPTFSSFNKLIRNKLTELEVEFAESN